MAELSAASGEQRRHPDDQSDDFAGLLRTARTRTRLTQEQLAERAGISVRSVRDIERGRVRYPRPETARLLGAALGHRGADLTAFVDRARARYWAGRRGPTSGGPDPADDRPGTGTGGPAPGDGRQVPAQLPAGLPGFVGRRVELDTLDRLLDRPAPAAACVLSGTAGVGKTTLAVHWANRVASGFPDGQFYVDLRGYGPHEATADPAEVLRGFLHALGVPPGRMPLGTAELAAAYRGELRGRRVLVLLDNARHAQQVRPLLPGASGCLVLVTSRDQLTGLVAHDGAHLLDLDLPTDTAARELLARRLGETRVAADPVAAAQIVAHCARLPLALSVVAAGATARPDFPLRAVADQLADAEVRLDAFDSGDPGTDVRSVLSWSYRLLSRDAARMFRRLALHPGPDLAAGAAGALTGLTPGAARRLLVELARAHLVDEHLPGRYAFHDLLRVYALELVRREETPQDRAAATRRLLEHYLHTTYAAAALLEPHRETVPLDPPVPDARPVDVNGQQAAADWLAAEQRVLTGCVRLAAEDGFPWYAWRLAWLLTTFLLRRGQWHELRTVQGLALRASRASGDLLGQAHAHRALARAHQRMGRYQEGHRHLRSALRLHRSLRDVLGQARVHNTVAFGLLRSGQPRQALRHNQRALILFRSVGHLDGQAQALNDVGWSYALLGEHRQTLVHCQRALDLLRRLGDAHGEACAWDSLGYAHQRLGDNDLALVCLDRALALFRQVDDRYLEADTLIHLGESHQDNGDPEAAGRSWSAALDIYRSLGHPDGRRLRERLRRLGRPRSAAHTVSTCDSTHQPQ